MHRYLGSPTEELHAAADGRFVADLAHFSVLRFSGDDAATFLQAQLSCDIETVRQSPASTFGAYCSPKGRVLGNFLLWNQLGIWHTIVHNSIAASLHKRLAMFVLRSKVKIIAERDWALLGLAGTACMEALHRISGVDLEQASPHAVHTGESLTMLGSPGQRVIVVAPEGKAAGLWHELAAVAQPAGTIAWEWGDIRQGIPWITGNTQDQFVPQMLNLELIGGVSFKKGCYPGQEIVARTQYLGKLKRRMYLAHAQAFAEPGIELHSDDVGGQANGMVVNAVPALDGGSDMLVVVQCDSVDKSLVRLASSDGPILKFAPLPYSLD